MSTKALMEEALERLLKGEGENVPSTAKLSMEKLTIEAGVASGAPYYKAYEEWRKDAAKKMRAYNAGERKDGPVRATTGSELKDMKEARDKQKELKEGYKEDYEAEKARTTNLYRQLGEAEYALYETQVKLAELEQLFETVTGNKPDDYPKQQTEVAMLPRNLQLVSKD
ncbi:conserved hypothetical protein [Ferrimonas balearica DSM 9799]|uniref:Uncharacterized protein n=1 Tax=Ferrimonas balearica (strain DSM 9799 / CCM 4581 / KCTC 23876 / PAT) TaxID=550540 RepID=E1SPZ2_FERBD|nr:hypothetical protein [Ferrimonas balearica]ADN75787.1 conserved hypothetical protein [Ferrimonas balearica DSM 9799]